MAPPMFLSSLTGRAAFLNKVGDANVNSGHTLGATAAAPGSNPSWTPDAVEGLTCVDCHHPHGSAGTGNPDAVKGQWRILKSNPGNGTQKWLNYEKSSETADLTKDIKWRYASAHADGAYETDGHRFL